MTRPWNLDTKERPAGRHLCAMPPGREPPFVFVHQPIIEREQGLQLAGLLLTQFPLRPFGRLTEAEWPVVARVQARLATLRRNGGLVIGSVVSVWTTPAQEGRLTPFEIQTEEWLRHMLARHASFSLRVERPAGSVH